MSNPLKLLRLALSMAAGAVVGLFLYEVVGAGLVWAVLAGVFTWETLQPVPWSWFPGSSWGPAGCSFDEGAHFPKGFNLKAPQDQNVIFVVLFLKYAVTAAVGLPLDTYTLTDGFPSWSEIEQDPDRAWIYFSLPFPLALDAFRRSLTKTAQRKSAAGWFPGWFPHLRIDAGSDVS